MRAALPTLEHVVHVPYVGGDDDALPDALGWDELLAERGPLAFDPVPFDHPLYVLFSSGTTGLPKPIVHGHGGILVEHFKNHGLSWDLQRGDRLMWFTTTAWMMWNALVSTLLLRASIVMLDGNPLYPDLAEQWRLAEETRPTLMGAGPALLMGCRKAGLQVGERSSTCRASGSSAAAGSPLPGEGFDWVYEQLGPDVLLNNGSGGTDVCCGIVQGSPLQPVYRGEIAGRCLAVDSAAFDADGREVVGELGELVIRQPMPSMPVGFWNDPGDARYRAVVLRHVPGRVAPRRLDPLHRARQLRDHRPLGRDAQPRRRAPRAPASSTRWCEELDEVVDSLVVHLEDPEGGPGELLLFVVLRDGLALDDDAARADRRRAAQRAVAAPRAGRRRGRARRPAHAHRQEARAAGEADPARHPARSGGRARRAQRPGRDRRVRGLRCGARCVSPSTL